MGCTPYAWPGAAWAPALFILIPKTLYNVLKRAGFFLLSKVDESTFSCNKAIRAIPGAPYPYIITGCPDGEGSWFQETVNNDPELATACKAAYKAI